MGEGGGGGGGGREREIVDHHQLQNTILKTITQRKLNHTKHALPTKRAATSTKASETHYKHTQQNSHKEHIL